MYNYNYRTKFGSQTFDNMDRWKRRGGKSRSEKIRERVRRKKMQVREKGRKVAIHCVFPMICGSGRSKSRLAKVAGAKPCGQMRDEKLHTVKTYKTHQGGSIFGSCDVQKVHTVLARSTSPSQMYKTHQGGEHFWKLWVVARSTCASQNVQSTPCSEHFWKLRCRKSTRCCCAKHISKSKVLKTDGFGALLDVQMWFCVAGARDCAPCQKWAKREGFVAFPKTMAGVGHLKRICKDAFRVAGAVQKTCSSEMLGGQGADFRRMAAFWSIRSSGLLRWFCVTGQAQHFVWPGITFSWQAQYFRDMGRKNCKSHWYQAVSSALNFPFLKEVSQNCFVLEVVKFKNWGRLAE